LPDGPIGGRAGVLSRQRVHALALLGATLLGLYLCYRLAEPFLPALTWGLALAVVAYPIHKFICRHVPSPTLAAGLSVAVVTVVIIVPVVLVIQQLIRQALEGVRIVQGSLEEGQWREAIESRPRLAPWLTWVEDNVALDDVTGRLSEYLGAWGPAFASGIVTTLVQLLVTLLVLFYLFRDRRDLAADVRSFLPLSEQETQTMLRRIGDTIHATLFGSLAVAAVQGFMGGLIFWALALPAPIVWGAVMAVLATIPVAGTFVVWAPAAIYLAATGAWGKAAVLVGWGAVAIGLIDNLLYPVLVGKRLRFHPLPVFFSIVGGLALFGAAGLVLGPLTLSVTAALFELLRRRTSRGRAADTPRSLDSAA
jgi:predicted PurR-regulated permease PerM